MRCFLPNLRIRPFRQRRAKGESAEVGETGMGVPAAGHGRYFDKLDSRSAGARRKAYSRALPSLLAQAKAGSPYWGRVLAAVEPAKIMSRSALSILPISRRTDLMDVAPIGPLMALVPSREGGLAPIARGGDPGRLGRALWAAGARPGTVILNAFDHHHDTLGLLVAAGAAALDCPVVPAGPDGAGSLDRLAARTGASFYCGPGSLLAALADRDVFAGALINGDEGGRNALGFQSDTFAGLIAFQCPDGPGWLVEEEVLLDIVHPGSAEPVAEGEVGEAVVTVITSTAFPVIRYATGLLTAALGGPSPCGRTGQRLRGWFGHV